MKKVGIALGGGGARGICHIEFLKVLDELGVKPSIVSGTSIGAIIGAMYASGLSGLDIEKIVHEIDYKVFLKLLDFSILSRASLIKGKGVENFLNEHIPADTFEELKIPLKVVATDFWREEDVVFETGELIPAIRGSLSIPAVFEPIIYQQRVLIDGGTSNNLPFDIIRDDCDILIAIDVSGTKSFPIEPKIPNWFDNMMTSFQILQSSIVEHQMKVCKPEIYIKPSLQDVGILDFDKINYVLQSVRKDVKYFRKELEKKLEQKKSILSFLDN
jgi:NTE family protein